MCFEYGIHQPNFMENHRYHRNIIAIYIYIYIYIYTWDNQLKYDMLVCGPLIARSFSAEFTEWFLWISPGGDWMNGDFAGENGDFALKNP